MANTRGRYPHYPRGSGSSSRKERRGGDEYSGGRQQRSRATKGVVKKNRAMEAPGQPERLNESKVQKFLETQQHGQPQSMTTIGHPSEFGLGDWKSRFGKHYFVAPVSEALRHHMRGRPHNPIDEQGLAGSIFVTGVSLQFQVCHAGPMDVFAVCIPVREGHHMLEVGMPLGSVFPITTLERSDVQRAEESLSSLRRLDNHHVAAETFGSIVSTPHADNGAAFSTLLESGILPGGDSRLNQGKQVKHSGVARWSLPQQSVGDRGHKAAFVAESCRSYWELKKEIPICDNNGNLAGERYVIIYGVEYKAGTPLSIQDATDQDWEEWIKDIKMTYYAPVKDQRWFD
ncbi:hypothetical protein EDB80DRAFT_713711 [Ilyonectria destructans]|nr:hypothetical protein EDB80DRAFT_713711 [Ilyonectria destructans]